jgi:hypothetical protein
MRKTSIAAINPSDDGDAACFAYVRAVKQTNGAGGWVGEEFMVMRCAASQRPPAECDGMFPNVTAALRQSVLQYQD